MSLIYIFLKDTPHWRLKLLLDLVILRNLEGAYPSWLKRENGRFRVQELCSHKSLNILLQVFAKYVNVHDLIKSDDRESQKIRLGNFSAEKLSLRLVTLPGPRVRLSNLTGSVYLFYFFKLLNLKKTEKLFDSRTQSKQFDCLGLQKKKPLARFFLLWPYRESNPDYRLEKPMS